MREEIVRRMITYLAAALVFVLGLVLVFGDLLHLKTATPEKVKFTQPQVQYGKYPWSIRSVDTQVISKYWPNVTKESVHEQVAMIKELGVNYIAIGTPYDKLADMETWANEIHSQELHVWFRSHWANWEGDEGQPANMTPDEYLQRTKEFILAHPSLFREGDAFTVAVEAEQVGIGLGKRFLTWDEYRSFLIREINTASEAFAQIGLGGKIHTNWLSVNGWIVMNEFNQELVDNIGLIVVDHFTGQSQTIGTLEDMDAMVNQTEKDLDEMYAKWKKPIFLGEWGYHIYQPVNDDRQAQVIQKFFNKLKTKPYLVGVNYWVHMGNSAAIISDTNGTNLKYRKGAAVVKSFFDPLSEPLNIN